MYIYSFNLASNRWIKLTFYGAVEIQWCILCGPLCGFKFRLKRGFLFKNEELSYLYFLNYMFKKKMDTENRNFKSAFLIYTYCTWRYCHADFSNAQQFFYLILIHVIYILLYQYFQIYTIKISDLLKKNINFTINSFHCNMKSRENHLFHMDMCIYLICLYYETLEMHLFSRYANKNVKQFMVLSDHCEKVNKIS